MFSSPQLSTEMEFVSVFVFAAVLVPALSQGFSKYNSPWGYEEPLTGGLPMGQTKTFPDPRKDVLFSDDWREDVARLEERLSQLEEELNRRYQPQRGFSNTGYQGYRNPPRTGRTQLSRSPTNLIFGNQYEGMGGYAKSPFNDFFPQRSPPSYDNTMRRHSQTPLSQRPNGPNPNPNNPGRKPTSNSKKQRGQEPMSANRLPLPPPAPIPNPPPISPPIVADPKSRNTDEMEFVRSSKSNNNQH